MSLDTTTSPSEEARENHFGFLEKQLEQTTSEPFDIFQQLSKKERDLELAAELGNVLLQENEELKHRIEVVTQDYHDKLEESNQKHHRLKLQLETSKLENETVVHDLRSDIADLQRQHEEELKRIRQREKGNLDTIQELTIQNERLADQVLHASMMEEEVRTEIGSLRLQVSESGTSYDDSIKEFDALHDEMTELKKEMENRIKLKMDECRLLTVELDQAQERVQILEKENLSLENKARHYESEYQRLEDINMQLLTKLESISMSAAMVGAIPMTNDTSLFAELEVLSHSMSVDSFDNRPMQKITIGTQLKQEILETYRQLQRLSLEIRGRGDQWSPEAVEINDLKAGQLLLMLTELRGLFYERMQNHTLPMVEDQSRVGTLERQAQILKEEIGNLKERLDCSNVTVNSLKLEITQRDYAYKHKCDELIRMQDLFALFQKDLVKVQQERDLLQDSAVGLLTRDSLLEKTRKERDEAVECKNQLSIHLSQAKHDLSTLNRQLLEAVDQKLQLSQQLEAWQSDMQELIETKMANEITQDQLRTKAAKIVPASSARKRFSLKWS